MKNRYVLLADLPLIVLAASAAFAARFDWTFYDRPEFVPYLLAGLLIKPVVFVLLGMYSRYWRYMGIQDLLVIFTAVSASSVGMTLFVVAGFGRVFDEFSRVVIFNDWLVTMAATGAFRAAIRVLGESTRRPGERPTGRRRVLIVGAGLAGSMVAREIRRNPHLGMEAVGFLDDDPVKVGKRLESLKVFGITTTLPDVVRSERVESVIIAMPTAPGATIRTVVGLCNEAAVASQTIPGVFELLNGQVSISRLRKVEITDLLRRSPVDVGSASLGFLRGEAVLVTGAGGSIGSELARQIANASPSYLTLLGHGENSIFDVAAELAAEFPTVRVTTIIADIRDQRRLAQVFARVRPTIVFHAAAHKHVPLMEANPEEAVTNNIVGTRNVVNEALRARTERLVFISTDKAVAPTSVMGASKRVAESIVRRAAQSSGRAFVVVRFGNVLGSRGSVVNTFKKQIENGGPVTVTDPQMSRFFMTIPEAVHLVLQASGKGKGGEVFVLDMGEPVRIVDLARDVIKLSGLTEDEIPIVFTGIRPGEKMHEALADAGARLQPTDHPSVLELVGDDPSMAIDLEAAIGALETAAGEGDRVGIDAMLAAAVPGFQPSARIWDVPVTGDSRIE